MPGFISFKPMMAQAILDDRKWQTRRLIKPQPTKLPDGWWQWTGNAKKLHRWQEQAIIADYMPHKVGDRPYVRESYWLNQETGIVSYGETKPADGNWKFVSAMFSLKRHSRLTIEITGVRVQQVRYISQADAADEGMLPNWTGDRAGWDPDEHGYLPLNWRQLHSEEETVWYSARKAFLVTWDHINPGSPVEDNPWVVAYTFRRVNNVTDEA